MGTLYINTNLVNNNNTVVDITAQVKEGEEEEEYEEEEEMCYNKASRIVFIKNNRTYSFVFRTPHILTYTIFIP